VPPDKSIYGRFTELNDRNQAVLKVDMYVASCAAHVGFRGN